ncbi:MAG: hypothetical protein ACYC3X_01975 [Pirellulaceae bacterium]
MKNTVWTFTAVLLVGSAVGCGSKEQSSNTTVQPVQAAGTSQPSAEPTEGTQVQVAADTPEQAVGSFLNALQTGDDKAAAALLTVKAREETAAHDMVVEPPGAPNATYSVGRVQHPDENPDAAYVSCLWSEKFENGEAESYEVVWVLRRETVGWRVAGMATQLSDSEEPVFLDFEDLAAMENAVKQAETAQASANGATQAQAPETKTLR